MQPLRASAAARNALLAMIDLIVERGYTREQAYVVCSVAVDLRISNIVDLPNVTVSAFLPRHSLAFHVFVARFLLAGVEVRDSSSRSRLRQYTGA